MMMNYGYNPGWQVSRSTQFSGLYAFMYLVAWLALVAFLLAGARWFWKKASTK